MRILLFKLNTCKEDFEKEHKDHEDQLQIMRNEIQELEERCQEKFHNAPESQITMNEIQVIN